MDTLRLQQEVLRQQRRGDRLAALLRLVIVVLKTSDVSLSNIRFPQGTAKRMLLRTIERSSCVLPLELEAVRITARKSRIETNRNMSCKTCEPLTSIAG
jgi:hypothetical protein